MKNNNNILGKIALALIIIVIIGNITSACDSSLSPKEYYAFSQRAYAYNHRND